MANKRRGHGEGSIYQRKDGRWTAAITLEDGGRKSFYGKTRREVQEKLKVALREQQQGTLVTEPQQTLKVYLEHWLEQVYKPTVRLNSYMGHRSVVNHHLIPGLGHITLQKLTPEKVQAFYREKLDGGLAARTVILIHAVLHQALENAVKWGLVARNVTDLVSLPRVRRYEAQVVTSEQARQLIDAALSSRIEVLMIVAIATGMRLGELCALRWDDVDFERGAIAVRRTVGRIPGYGYVENEPKSKSGRREILLPAVAVGMLREHKVLQEQVCVVVGEKWQERGLVFPNGCGGFLNPDRVRIQFKRVLKIAALPRMRFHDLRHSSATILLVAGVHPKVVQERLGHSSISMTLDVYSHVIPSMQQEAAGKMDDMLKH